MTPGPAERCSATDSFYALLPEQQMSKLGSLVQLALLQWGLENVEIEPLAYRQNSTFRVSTGDRAYAMRVHQAGYRTDAQIRSELDFMRHLNASDVPTPAVVLACSGCSFVTVRHPEVPEPRQCSLFEWIDGAPLRQMGEPITMSAEALTDAYRRAGALTARICSLGETWTKPKTFDRLVWDEEGIYGPSAHLGDFRTLPGVPKAQMNKLIALAEKLDDVLARFGKSPDRFGMVHGDLLPENIFVDGSRLRLIDFDDVGYGWYLFEIATAAFDLLGTENFDHTVAAMVAGFREHRQLPDEHLTLLPAFLIAKALSFLGWCAERQYLPQAEPLQTIVFDMIDAVGPVFLAGERLDLQRQR